MISARHTLPVILALCAASSLSRATPAQAGTPNVTNRARLDGTVRYLQDVQRPDGGFGNEGEEPSQDFSAWVAFALAADGINPQDQARPNGVDAYTFLLTHAREALPKELCEPVICTTSFERELLVVDASGTSPHDFAGFDLVKEILARQLPNGAFPFVPEGEGEVNDTVFATLALSLVHEPSSQAAVQSAARWLIGAQDPDGSWPSLHPRAEQGEVDMTGAVIQALNAAGRRNTPAERKALEYLRKAQEPDGGFPEFPSEGESNVASTAWVAQGIWSTGGNPETWVTSSHKDPLSYMESLQQPDGHIRWKRSQDMNGVWMTAYVAPAFAGQALPIAPVPRSVPSPPTAPGTEHIAPEPGAPQSGQGGESPQPGGGVLVGGGGKGAPLFSRPLPQSRGNTPGGVRLLSDTHQRVTRESTKQRSPRKDPQSPRSHADRQNRAVEAPTTTIAAPSGIPVAGPDGRRSQSVGQEVQGVPIGLPNGARNAAALEPGAPGLRSAGAGGSEASWLAICIASLLLLSALVGSQLERRRPQVIL